MTRGKLAKHLPLTHIGGALVALATNKDMAMSSQFLQANKNGSHMELVLIRYMDEERSKYRIR